MKRLLALVGIILLLIQFGCSSNRTKQLEATIAAQGERLAKVDMTTQSLIPTATPTSVPTPLPKLSSASDPKQDVAFGFIDILSVQLRIDGDDATAKTELAELPRSLTFNFAPPNRLEYEWGIYFDVDDNPSTGDVRGSEYSLEVMHFAPPKDFGTPIADGELLKYAQTHVATWDAADKTWHPIAKAAAFVDYDKRVLMVQGKIPGLNMYSKWFARTSFYDPASGRNHYDMAPDVGLGSLN